MNILIIEDEHYAAKRLVNMITSILPEAKILEVLDSVEDSKEWFKNNEEPNLVFMDIQLADGLSFKIFEHVKFSCPVIFITAFDEYAIDAFKLNSVDYLLKPIEEEKLRAAIDKFKRIHEQQNLQNVDWSKLGLSLYANKDKFKKRFLVKTGAAFQYLNISEIVLLYSDESLSFAINVMGKRFLIDNTIEQIEQAVDPSEFFRINRKHIVAINSINKIHPFLNSRLKLELNLKTDQELVVSREKVKQFKSWVQA